jgi:hypothetical protein
MRARVIARRRARGATFMQYVVITGFVAVAALIAYKAAGPKIADNLTNIAISVMGLDGK